MSYVKKIQTVIILFGIIVLAFVLRTHAISSNPPSLSWDEVSIGYNAYSILKTGKDEHGRFLPLNTFVAYGDYKPPMAIYLTVPFVALFGLNELAVRLPSALFGTATVLLTYFLVLELFLKSPFRRQLATLSSFVLAISPWHVNISRAGFEANIALFFIVLGTWLLVYSRKHPKLLLVVWLPFAAAIYTFNSSRVFAPLFGIALLAFVFSSIRKQWKLFSVGIAIALISLLPIIPHLFSKEARLRFTEVNIFTDSTIVQTSNERIAQEGNTWFSKIINNRRVGFARSFLIHFFDNFQPYFLFNTGDGNPKFSIQDVGQLYMFEAPFLAIGIFGMFLSYPSLAALLVFWLLAAIVPAATARETPHALRILNSLPTWQVFVAFGILQSVEYVRNLNKKTNLYRTVFILLLVVFYGFGLMYYLHNYYYHYPREYSGEWQYGYKQALQKISPIADKYDTIVITELIGRPYMYTLFYTKTNPSNLFATVDSYFDAAGFYHVKGFGKYKFGGMLPGRPAAKTLYIWDAGSEPKSARIIDTIHLLNGNPELVIFDDGSVKL